MKKKNKLLLAALGLVMALVLSGCIHTETNVEFMADGSVHLETGLYYSESYFELIEVAPEDFFRDLVEAPVSQPDLITKEYKGETYYGLTETADVNSMEEFLEALAAEENGWTGELFTEDGKEGIRLTIPMKSDEEALEDQASEDMDLGDLSQVLSADFNLTFPGGVKSVSGVSKDSYKINKNTVTVNLISEAESKTFVVEGWLGTAAVSNQPLTFTDVKPGDYFYEAVQWAFYAKPQVTDGMSDTLFGTGKTCTRGQVVTFLWRAAGCPEPKSANNPFKDVKASDYFYKPVLWAVENKITDGTAPDKFSPANPCTYGHIITFIHRAMGCPTPVDPYEGLDVPQSVRDGFGMHLMGAENAAEAFPDWTRDAFVWAEVEGVLSGTYSNTYAEFPIKAPCPRKNVVYYLWKIDELRK